ncbi:MAG: hypothetical protein RLY86_3461 [Pseudomonadota bacterium]|jgi:hypothetical protein
MSVRPLPDRFTQVRICDWLPPDFGAVGQSSLQLARNDARDGRDILLIGLSTTDGRADMTERFDQGSLTVRYVPMPALDRSSNLRRLVWTVRANLRLIAALWGEARRADEVHFTGSPPFLLHFMVPLKLLLRKPLAYMISDFYPECVMATKERPSLLMQAFYKLTCAFRRRVDRFEALGFDQRRLLTDIGIAEDRISIRRDLLPVCIPDGTVPLDRPAGAEGKALLLYSGNYGVAHEVTTFVDGYVRHHREGSGRTLLWLNAIGAGAEEIESRLTAVGVPFIRSKLVALEDVPRLLVTPDAHLIALKDSFVGYVMPSKTYGCLDSGRDILFVGSERSDVHYLCTEERKPTAHYWRVDTGNGPGMAAALEAVADRAANVQQESTARTA